MRSFITFVFDKNIIQSSCILIKHNCSISVDLHKIVTTFITDHGGNFKTLKLWLKLEPKHIKHVYNIEKCYNTAKDFWGVTIMSVGMKYCIRKTQNNKDKFGYYSGSNMNPVKQ